MRIASAVPPSLISSRLPCSVRLPMTAWSLRWWDPGGAAGADFDDEQAVQALQRQRAVDMEETGGEHGRRLGVQELPPGRVGVTLRRGRNTQCPENPADRGRADPVAELEHLALDPL